MPDHATIRASTGNWFQEYDNPPVLRVLEEHGAGSGNNPPLSSCSLSSLKTALQLIELKGYENGRCPVLFGDNAKIKLYTCLMLMYLCFEMKVTLLILMQQ